MEGVLVSDIWIDEGIKPLQGSSSEYIGFLTQKPVSLIKRVLKLQDDGGDNNSFILDFFAGSGTTGEAVMQLNSDTKGNRKYILVQLPEEINPQKDKISYDFVKKELKIGLPVYIISGILSIILVILFKLSAWGIL